MNIKSNFDYKVDIVARRHRRYSEKKLEILRSAAAVFSRKGFSSATMEEIGEALHMTKGSLYYYFNSKQDLLYFCQKHSLRRLLEEAVRITSTDQSPPQQLFELIVCQIRCMLDELQGSAAHIEFRELPQEQLQQIISMRDSFEAALRRVVQEGIEEGMFYSGDPRISVWAILGAINWTVQWFSPAGPLSAGQIGREFARFLVRGLTRPEFHVQIPAASEKSELEMSLRS